MALQLDGVIFDELSGDPGSPVEGQMWFNTTSHQVKIYRNGAVDILIDKATFDAHANSTLNPHATTLEQARTANSTLGGSVNFGGYAGTNIGAGSAGTDVAQRQWTTDQINAKVKGLDWQDPVINSIGTPPGGPVTGDRYRITAIVMAINAVNQGLKRFTVTGDASALIAGNTFTVSGSTGNDGTYTVVSATYGAPNTDIIVVEVIPNAVADGNINYASGVWNAKVNQIAEYGTSSWSYYVPVEGSICRDMTANTYIVFDGTSWGNFGNAVDHNSLLNLTVGDAHTQYQLRSERNQNNGYAGLGATGTIDDTRHGARGGGTLHSNTSSAGAGFYQQSVFNKTVNPTVNDDGTAGWVPGSRWLNTTNQTEWVCISNGTGAAVWSNTLATGAYLVHKSGKVLAASFAGTPRKATVTFVAPFSDANYAVVITPIISVSGTRYTPNVESQVAGSFVINMGTSIIGSLVSVAWVAVKNGESS